MTKAERIFWGQEKKKAENVSTVQMQNTRVMKPDGFDTAWNQYAEDMTSEETQKELLDVFILYVLAARKLNRVAYENVLDSEGKITEGRTMIEKVRVPEVIGKINSIIENNLGLL